MPSELFSDFLKERAHIGDGANAKVYAWRGFAYKCFRDGYDKNWLAHERRVQAVIEAAGLPAAKYYDSEFENTIKMELIDGVSLADRMRKQRYKGWLNDMLELFNDIHTRENLPLSPLKPALKASVMRANIDNTLIDAAISYIDDIPDANTLCHLDYHFLNIMYADGRYRVIDWVNAKIGNPIFDFARTYVIMNEFAYRLSGVFLRAAKARFAEDDLRKAVFVMAADRLAEFDKPQTRKLLDTYA